MKNDLITIVTIVIHILLTLGILILGLMLSDIQTSINALATKPATPKVKITKVIKPHKYYVIDRDIDQGKIVCKEHKGLSSIRVEYVETDLLRIMCNDTLIIGNYKY